MFWIWVYTDKICVFAVKCLAGVVGQQQIPMDGQKTKRYSIIY